MMLLSGSTVDADAFAIINHRLEITKIDKQLAELDPPDPSATDLIVFALKAGLSTGLVTAYATSVKVLKDLRRTHTDAIEQIVRMTADEARAEAEAGGQDVLGVDQAIRGRVTSVLGGDDTAERAVGGTQAKLINAIGRVDHAEQAAAELRKLDERGQLTTDVLAQVLRNLRQQAENEVLRLYPDATRDELAEHTRQLSDQWFIHLRTTWDAAVVGSGRTFSQVLDRGSQVDVDYKRTLYMASGQLSDVDELVLALRGDRKDLETVKRVLRNKTREQIDELKRQYKIKTTTADNKWGGSLDEDLLGFSPSEGKAKGTDRLLVEDYLSRPYAEGGKEEVDYIVRRAEREHSYTIENRGATGWWRDHWGNEARSLLDATLREVREKRIQYYTLTKNGTDRSAMHSREAVLLIRDLHLARATIRGDRAGYEKATAELRATFQSIASFVLQAVLTAVLSPAAAALFRGISAAAAATRYGLWLKNTVVTLSSTIAANKAVYGNAYNREMFYADLRGGLSGAIGSAAVGRLVDPIAGRLQARLGKEMTGEFIEGVKTYGGLQATAALEGQGLVSFDTFAREHFLNKVGDKITHTTATGLEKAGYREGGPHRQQDEQERTHTQEKEQHPHQTEDNATDNDTSATREKRSTEDDSDAEYEPPPVPMTLPTDLDRPAPSTKTATKKTHVPEPVAPKPSESTSESESAEPIGCFVAGTTVLTPKGLRPIETIVTGDLVAATDPVSGEQSIVAVIAVMTYPDRAVLRLEWVGGGVQCTSQHPFWVDGHGWLTAGELQVGMSLHDRHGADRPLTVVEGPRATDTVHNLSVAGPHTYHVTDVGVLVHNKPRLATPLPPLVEANRAGLEQRVIGIRERAQRILDQARAIPDNRPEGADLAARAEDLHERFEQLQDDLNDTPEQIDGVHRPATNQAEAMLGNLQSEVNAAYVPAPTGTEWAQIDAYDAGVAQLRAALDAGNVAAQAAAQQQLDQIEQLAFDSLNVEGSDTPRLWDHLETMINQRGQMERGEAYPLFGQALPCQASAASAGLRGLTYRQIEAQLGIPVRDPKSASPGEDGRVRLVWTFPDRSTLHVDIPGRDTVSSSWQISREAHIGINAAPPNQAIHLSMDGIAVPDRSAPAHLPIGSDDLLNARRQGIMTPVNDLDAAGH
jgi:hypothetical protein